MLLQKIKNLCKQNNTTIAELERILKLGNGTIQKWGKANPTTENLAKVAAYFHVSTDILLTNVALPTQDALDMARVFDLLTEEQKGLVKCYISIIKKDNAVIT